jgi:hypothetical protein
VGTYVDASGAELLIVIDRSTGYVWQATPASGTVFPGYPGNEQSTAYDFQYAAAGCTGPDYFSFGAGVDTPPPGYTFFGTDGNLYALDDTAAVATVTLLSSKTVATSPACAAEDIVGTGGVLVTSCIDVGTTVPTSLFTPPAHPVVVP